LDKNRQPDFPLVGCPHGMFRDRVQRWLLVLIFWVGVLAWAATIVWLSSLTPSELPRLAFLAWDKINHFAAFAVGGWLTATALRLSRPQASTAAGIMAAIVLVSLFGAFDELHQLYTPDRTGADWYDWIADSLGAIVGASSSLLTHARLERLVSRP
jgi:VanZ family protein